MKRFTHKILRFYSFNIIKLSLAFLFLGLTFLILSPLLENVDAVPCKRFDLAEPGWGVCAVNPVVESDTLYFSNSVLDLAYQVFYLVMLALMVPYSLACFGFSLYYDYIKKIIGTT